MFLEKSIKLFKNDFLRSSVFAFFMVLSDSKRNGSLPSSQEQGHTMINCDADHKC